MTRQPVFSRALFAHCLRRFWPFMAAVFVLLLLPAAGMASLVQLTLAVSDRTSTAVADPVRTVAVLQLSMAPGMCVSAAIACLVAALLAFRHLRDRAELQFYMGMPVSRTCLFLTAHASALCLVALPFAAVAALVAVLELACGLGAALPGLGVLALACACALLLFGGLASLSCVATGRAGAAVLAYACLNMVAIAVYGASSQAIQQFLVGVPLDSGEALGAVMWLTPVANLARASVSMPVKDGVLTFGFNEPEVLVVYALAGVVLAVAAWALYRARPTERTGETMAFAGARVAFQAVAALVVASLGAMAVSAWGARYGQGADSAAAVRYAVCMVAFAAVGWAFTEMFVRRTPRVFDLRTLAGCASVAGALVVVFVLLSFDAFGVVRWVPDPSQVERAEVSFSGTAGAVDPADAVAVHRAVLDNRGLLDRPAAGYGSYRVGMVYDMADGSHVERSYLVYEPAAPDGEMSSDVWLAAKAALDAPDAVYRATFGTDRELSQADIEQVSYELDGGHLDTGRPYDYNWAPFSRTDAYNLYRAAAQDIREGNATRFTGDEIGSITFELRPGVADEASRSESSPSGGFLELDLQDTSQPSGSGAFTGRLAITPEMGHTLAWIEAFELQADWQERPADAGGAL